MESVELPDGGRLNAKYEWSRDSWTAWLGGSERVVENRWLHAATRDLLSLPPESVSPPWLLDAVQRLAGWNTPLGRRVMCRCCGYLTLPRYGCHDICPVCYWEDDPTTIFERGELPVGGPNQISLGEARRNFALEGVCCPSPAARIRVRDPLPAERP
jgi:hypothetical protein